MMATTAKRSNKTLYFTQEDEDQALLKKAEQLLAEERFSSFNELGKEALRRFLADMTADQPASAVAADIDTLQQQLARIEAAVTQTSAPLPPELAEQVAGSAQQAAMLNTKMDEVLEQFASIGETIRTELVGRLGEIERHMSSLADQYQQLEASRQPPPQPEAVAAPPPREADPLVQRLGRLLERF